jgi:hypothetical protein
MTSATTETNGHKAEFGMTGTTFTGDSTTLKREAYLQSLGLPDEKASGELVRRLIKNVISIKDETGACNSPCREGWVYAGLRPDRAGS